MTEVVSWSKASRMLGVTAATPCVWDKDGKIPAVQSPGGHEGMPLNEIHRHQPLPTEPV